MKRTTITARKSMRTSGRLSATVDLIEGLHRRMNPPAGKCRWKVAHDLLRSTHRILLGLRGVIPA